MQKHPLVIKELTIAVIFLFLSVSIAPTINIQIVKASTEDKLVKVTTETHSIPTIQCKTKLLRTYEDFVEKLKTGKVSDLKDILIENEIKHKLLLAWVVLVSRSQFYRLFINGVIGFYLYFSDNIFPILGLLIESFVTFNCLRLFFILQFTSMFWYSISETFGWNWDESPYFPF